MSNSRPRWTSSGGVGGAAFATVESASTREGPGEGARKGGVQAAVDYWYPRVQATFGRVESDHARQYIDYGLRRRDNAAMLTDWTAQMAAAGKRLGIKMPA